MYKNEWRLVMEIARDAFCISVGLASVAAKYEDSKKFAERVCYAHDVLQKIESAALQNTVVRMDYHLFRRLWKKLLNN